MVIGANLSLLFTEVPMVARFGAARAAGFDAVELLFPYDHDLNALEAAARAAGLPVALINTPCGDWATGERGFAAVPGEAARFRDGFAQALEAADALGAARIHVMAGIAEGPRARAVFVENLAWAVAQGGPELCIEPINRIDMPGYALGDFDLAVDVLEAVGSDRLGLQFDAYHAHRITGDVLGTWDRLRDRVVHVQVAGAEGRHEPVAGAIDYPAFFARLRADGYAGVVSGEYHPEARTEDGLEWMQRM